MKTEIIDGNIDIKILELEGFCNFNRLDTIEEKGKMFTVLGSHFEKGTLYVQCELTDGYTDDEKEELKRLFTKYSL